MSAVPKVTANMAALETGGELPDETSHMFDPAFAIDDDYVQC